MCVHCLKHEISCFDDFAHTRIVWTTCSGATHPTLLEVTVFCGNSWVSLLLGTEDSFPLSLCLCLHSRQFLTATQHTGRAHTKDTHSIQIGSYFSVKWKLNVDNRAPLNGISYLWWLFVPGWWGRGREWTPQPDRFHTEPSDDNMHVFFKKDDRVWRLFPFPQNTTVNQQGSKHRLTRTTTNRRIQTDTDK